MYSRSQVFWVYWPYKDLYLQVHEDVVMTEAAVRGGKTDYVVYLLWGNKDVPKKGEKHIEQSIRKWLEQVEDNLKLDRGDILNLVWGAGEKEILLTARFNICPMSGRE